MTLAEQFKKENSKKYIFDTSNYSRYFPNVWQCQTNLKSIITITFTDRSKVNLIITSRQHDKLPKNKMWQEIKKTEGSGYVYFVGNL